jgi:hypothetical protein
MDGRAVEGAASELRELEHATWEDLGLAALALGLAIAATRAWPSLAMPLFLGGVAVGALGVRALVRHWDLLDRLADERDAYVIPAVRKYALRETSVQRRKLLAFQLRATLAHPRLGDELRSIGLVEELDALASELADDDLVLEPLSAVACKRLLGDPQESPLYAPAVRQAELRARIRDVRSGFGPRRLAA